jgi:regulator of nucleoside diphosphate kinase
MISEAVPPIVIPAGDIGRLRRLALQALKADDPTARFLLSELDRATVYETTGIPDDVVRAGHWVGYRRDDGAAVITRVLAFPEECVNPDIHLSVMSPVGAALLGLRVGARMPYRDSDGVTRVATVENLTPQPGIAVFRRSVPRSAPRTDFDPPPGRDPGPSAA